MFSDTWQLGGAGLGRGGEGRWSSSLCSCIPGEQWLGCPWRQQLPGKALPRAKGCGVAEGAGTSSPSARSGGWSGIEGEKRMLITAHTAVPCNRLP